MEAKDKNTDVMKTFLFRLKRPEPKALSFLIMIKENSTTAGNRLQKTKPNQNPLA